MDVQRSGLNAQEVDVELNRHTMCGVGTMLAILTLPLVPDLFRARENFLNPLKPGETVKVASEPEVWKVADGAFPRSGGVVRFGERQLLVFNDTQGRLVAVPPQQAPDLAIGDEVTIDLLGKKIGEASSAHITTRATGRDERK